MRRIPWVRVVTAGALVLGASREARATSPTLEATLVPSDGVSGDWFGAAVALDGNTAVVGAPYKQNSRNYLIGSAYVFVGTGTNWSQQAELSSVLYGDTNFGASVAVSGDTVVVGDPLTELVHVFVRNGTNWSEQQALQWSDGGYRFGQSVAIYGNTIAVGDPGILGSGAFGYAYVAVRQNGSWSTIGLGSNVQIPNDRFGCSVAVGASDIVVGASAAGVSLKPGAAYVYHGSGTTWSRPQVLSPCGFDLGGAQLEFGASVAISGDMLVIGAPAYAGQQGVVYTYIRDSTGTWTDPFCSCNGDSCQEVPLHGQYPNDAQSQFGASVSLNTSGTLVVGAPGASPGYNSGSAYGFQFTVDPNAGPGWSQVWMTQNSGPYGSLGTGVAVSGNTALIGAPSAASGGVFVETPPPAPPSGAPATGNKMPVLTVLLLLGGLVGLTKRRES